jgi:hypothetical protein
MTIYTDDNEDETLDSTMEIVDIEEVDVDGNKSGAAMPDIQALLRAKVITVNPLTGLPDTPENPFRKRLIRTKKKGGLIEEKIELIYGGHVQNPLHKGWRIGLDPETYFKYLEMERDSEVRGKKEQIAPTLTEDEFEAFQDWLTNEKGINMQQEDVTLTEVIKEISDRKKAAAKKKVESGEATLTPNTKKATSKKATPTKEVVVDEVTTDTAEDTTEDDLSDL